MTDALSLALRVLAEAEALPDGATGALVYGGDVRGHGAVLVESGRICAVLSTGLRSKLLTDLCASCEPRLDESELRGLLNECLQRGRPLGPYLLECRALSPNGLLRTLRQHALDALVEPSSPWNEPARWLPHRSGSGGYRAHHTFSPVELLAGASALVRDGGGRAPPVQQMLAELDDPNDATAFDLHTGSLVALQGSGAGVPRLQLLPAIGHWATTLLNGGDGLGEDVVRVTRKAAGLGVLVAWKAHTCAVVSFCHQRETFLALMAALKERGLTTAVLCGHLPQPAPQSVSLSVQ